MSDRSTRGHAGRPQPAETGRRQPHRQRYQIHTAGRQCHRRRAAGGRLCPPRGGRYRNRHRQRTSHERVRSLLPCRSGSRAPAVPASGLAIIKSICAAHGGVRGARQRSGARQHFPRPPAPGTAPRSPPSNGVDTPSMLALIRVALSRPYTFIVLALLILISGLLSWRRTPTDIFPNIDIPVITAVWTLQTACRRMTCRNRIVYYFERALSAQVNDIEHVESQSLATFGVGQDLLPEERSHRDGACHRSPRPPTRCSSRSCPALPPPNVLMFNASSVPILNLALSGKGLSEAQLARHRQQLHSSPTRHGARGGRAYALWRTGAPGPDRHRSAIAAILTDSRPADVASTLAAQNLITPVGTQKIGKFEYVVNLNDAPQKYRGNSTICRSRRSTGRSFYIRDVRVCPRRAPAADKPRARGWRPRGADEHRESRLGLHARHHQGYEGPVAEDQGGPAQLARHRPRWAINRSS